MICYIDRLPLSWARHRKLCIFCCFIFCLPIIFRLAIKKAWLRITRPRSVFIGIALTEHMGDIVAAEPILQQLRRDFPNGFFIWFVGKNYREIVENHPDIDQSVALRCLTEWIILSKSGLLDNVFDLHLPNRVCTACHVPLLKKSGNLQISADNYYSFGNLLTVLAQNAGLPPPTEGPALHIPFAAKYCIDKISLPDRFVCIHCLANESVRDWTPVKWREFVKILTEKYRVNVVEIGLSSAIEDFSNPHFFNLCGRLSILETAEVIRRAASFISTDSGPAHLANAVCTYGIIILGHYRNFPRYMPYSGAYEAGTNAKILFQDGPVSDMPVERVLGALLKRFGDDLQPLTGC